MKGVSRVQVGVFELGSTIVKRTPFGGLSQKETNQTNKWGGVRLE